jgi:formylglycine-generating enzyme required for sulfatase activity
VYGNAWEWCHDPYAPYPEAANLTEKRRGVADLSKQVELNPDDASLKRLLDEAKTELKSAETADAEKVFRDDTDAAIIHIDQKRVVRGGSAKSPVASLRSANRSDKLPSESSGNGFRIARTIVDLQGNE